MNEVRMNLIIIKKVLLNKLTGYTNNNNYVIIIKAFFLA